ncbi:hypothetical protein RB653_000499 [Dictyostelium firmibasis]|uniref:Uncharacterized protein n=1 Tax=Dictyostelium firmibasis TaxID=79012 RepID=A0AAN7U3E4_9MYCE
MDNSKIFFTIFRNKILRSLIWEFVKKTNDIRRNLVQGDNKLTFSRKYKDIHQVVWMVNYNHLGLLKSKLENNEYLSFGSNTLSQSILSKVKDEYVFDMLYNRYRDEFKNISDSLIEASIRYGNIGALKVLLRDQEQYDLHNISNCYKTKKINKTRFKINGTYSGINENTFKIKMIDLAIRSGKPEIVEFLVEFLKEKQKQIDEIEPQKEKDPNKFPLSKSSIKALVSETNNEIKTVYDYSSRNEPIKITIEKKSLIETHFTEKDLLSNCFRAPINNIKNIVQYLFFQENKVPFNIDNITLDYYPTCPIKFIDAFNFTNLDQLSFFLEKNLLKYNHNDFMEVINSFSFFSNDINPLDSLVYLKKFTYIYEHYYCKEKNIIDNFEPLHKSLEFISSLVDSINTPIEIEKLLKTTHTIKITLKSNQPVYNPENKTWLSPSSSKRGILLANGRNNINTMENKSIISNEEEIDSQAFIIINIDDDNDKKLINSSYNNEIENRVMNKIITIYMYRFFYPLVFLFQQAKIDTKVNKFLILKNDLSILSEANSIFNRFNKAQVSLKYFAFKEILKSSLETGNIEPLRELEALSRTIKGDNYIKEYASVFTLSKEFKMFKYMGSGWDKLKSKEDYLRKFIEMKNDSFLSGFQYASLFIWSSYEDIEEVSSKLMETLKSLIPSKDIVTKSDYKNSIIYKSVSSGNYLLTEFCLIDPDYFEPPILIYYPAINGKYYKIMNLLFKYHVVPDEFSFSRAVEINDLLAVTILIENKTPFKQRDLDTSSKHVDNPEIFRYLVMNVPPIDEVTGEHSKQYSRTISLVVNNNKILINILKENIIAFENGVFGDPLSLKNGHQNELLALINQDRMNTIQLFRQSKQKTIINFLLDFDVNTESPLEPIYKKQVLLKHIKLLYEVIDYNQMDFFYQLLDIFYRNRVFHMFSNSEDSSSSDKTATFEFNEFIIHCAKNNHYDVLNYLFKTLEYKLFCKDVSSVFYYLTLNHSFLSKEVVQILYDWSIFSDFPIGVIKSDLLILMTVFVEKQRFSLFKFINENFFSKFNSSTMPMSIYETMKKHQNPNIYLRNYLFFEKNENGEETLIEILKINEEPIDLNGNGEETLIETLKINEEPKRKKLKIRRLDLLIYYIKRFFKK